MPCHTRTLPASSTFQSPFLQNRLEVGYVDFRRFARLRAGSLLHSWVIALLGQLLHPTLTGKNSGLRPVRANHR